MRDAVKWPRLVDIVWIEKKLKNEPLRALAHQLAGGGEMLAPSETGTSWG
jgi:hypothetical protein